MIPKIEPFFIALLVGLLIGIDRERSLPAGMKGMGVRTFILIALLGTLAASVADITLASTISLFAFGAILLNYFTTTKFKKNSASVGLTTALAAGAVFCLGYLAPKEPGLVAVVAGAILVILLGRHHLHVFAREKLQPKEISAATTMLIIFLSVLVFLPNKTIDPWDLINPRRLGMLVAIISAMQFIGYVAIRIFGDRLGVLFMGFFGGLVSSTAVFATLPRFLKNHPERAKPAAAAALLATVGMLLEFTVIMFFAAKELLIQLIAPISVMIIVGILSAVLLFRKNGMNSSIETPRNPLDFKSVFYLSSVIAGMLFIVALAKRYVGTDFVYLITFLGGLLEVHSVSLATATLFVGNKLSLIDAKTNLYLALIASYITKYVLLWGVARDRFALLSTIFLTVMIGSGAAAAIFL